MRKEDRLGKRGGEGAGRFGERGRGRDARAGRWIWMEGLQLGYRETGDDDGVGGGGKGIRR
jgi:hypothetical protein